MRVKTILLAVALALGAEAAPVQADWGTFYQGSTATATRSPALTPQDMTGMHPRSTGRTLPRLSSLPTAPQTSGDMTAYPADAPAYQPDPMAAGTNSAQSVCIAEILRAQERHGIPDNILLGIGLQEAGTRRRGVLTVWPWAVNAAGVGRIFDDRTAAMDWVRERQAAGVSSIDVGCMQINLHWHPTAFATLEQGFDPVANVDYAARFLRSLHAESGDWIQAAGAYHSRTPDRAAVYLASLRRNIAVANDRIAGFRQMAGEVQPYAAQTFAAQAQPAQTLPIQSQDAVLQEAAVTLAPWNHGHWSTQPADQGGVYGIYSRAQLEPVLPHFLEDF